MDGWTDSGTAMTSQYLPNTTTSITLCSMARLWPHATSIPSELNQAASHPSSHSSYGAFHIPQARVIHIYLFLKSLYLYYGYYGVFTATTSTTKTPFKMFAQERFHAIRFYPIRRPNQPTGQPTHRTAAKPPVLRLRNKVQKQPDQTKPYGA